MKCKILILIAVVGLASGCAQVNGNRTWIDANNLPVRDEIHISTFFAKSALTKFTGGKYTKQSGSLVTFDAYDAETSKIEELGKAFGEAAGAAMKTAIKP